jgi:Peptidase M1 N-terminal domain
MSLTLNLSRIKPLNYNLSLFNLEFGGNWGYDGLVKIDSKVTKATQEVVLNTKELKITSADILDEEGKAICSMTDVSYDTSNERATIKLSKSVPSGAAVIAIKFKGTMNSSMAGFYRARYKPTVTPAASTAKADSYHYMFSTQFEACDARRAFPCFDEPNLKASFEFEIEIPDDQVALSNMPEKSVTKGSKDGLKKVSFEKTPVMSTYVSPLLIYSPFILLTVQSLQRGRLATLSMLKPSLSGSTKARICLFECIQLEASKNKDASLLNTLTRLWTTFQKSSVLTTPCQSLICLLYTSLRWAPWRTGDSSPTERRLCFTMRRSQTQDSRTELHMWLHTSLRTNGSAIS